MALDEGDKAIVGEIAGGIIEKVLKVHVDICPHGKALHTSKMVLIGIFIGSGVFSSSLALVLAKVILKL